ncbi:NUDIX hydrolase [Vallitalea longa]|uniref:NUDIX hydrolase n=1 Tax=Vallitalea longa TaxID=2936439 RepID=A0A9W6DGS8_9FIRM|nr:NUDIX domain-containing protein [Vallitalea longa]GKX30753.1 NUDIX hydrolase [Vallitalea longa]
MEIWDLYNDKRQLLDKTHNRQDKMEIGKYHIAINVWTVNDDNKILLTLRHPNKEKYPNLWENTGGSVLAGETSKGGAIRELNEETGIVADESDLFFLGTRKEKTAFVDTYIIRKSPKISELKLQDGETVEAQWVTLDKLDDMIKSRVIALPVAERLVPLRKEFEDFLYSDRI